MAKLTITIEIDLTDRDEALLSTEAYKARGAEQSVAERLALIREGVAQGTAAFYLDEFTRLDELGENQVISIRLENNSGKSGRYARI